MRLREVLVCSFVFAAAALFTTAAAADRRVALVIGNAAYTNASTLANTINDATAIGAMFRAVGFEVVISRTDLGVVDFKRAVREFLLTAENSDIAVVYYAGHGVEIGGINYLIPVDAKLGRDYDVEDEAVALDRIIWALQSVRRLRLILLDACRDNPFPAKLRSAGARAIVRGGLTKIDDVSADTLVAYAAKAGSVSYDGNGPNSPYATALLKHLGEPGLDIRIALGRVRDEVIGMTGGRQEPFIYGSLGGATIPLVPAVVARPVEPPPPAAVPETAVAVRQGAPVAPPPSNPLVPPAPAPAQVAVATPDPAAACRRDEARLARLRADPSRDEIARFRSELACDRLRAQLQRLLESIAADAPPAAPAVSDRGPAPAPAPGQAQAPAIAMDNPCPRDGARLAQLRAAPSVEAITRFERELGCEQLRPQLQRLRESVAGDGN